MTRGWIPWEKYDHLLGTKFDTEIAEMAGCSVAAVNQRRNHLGIPRKAATKVDWGRWDPLLGTMSDSSLARKIGVSQVRVSQRRRALGIELFEDPKGGIPHGYKTVMVKLPEELYEFVCSEQQRRNARFLTRTLVEIITDYKNSA